MNSSRGLGATPRARSGQFFHTERDMKINRSFNCAITAWNTRALLRDQEEGK